MILQAALAPDMTMPYDHDDEEGKNAGVNNDKMYRLAYNALN